MKVPARSAAAMIISPLRPATWRPSRVKVTASSLEVGSLIRAASLFDVDQELVAEHLDGRADRRGDRGAEDADGGLLGRPGEPGGDVVAHIEQQVEVLLASPSRFDPHHHLEQPARPFPAWGALVARLPGEELGDAPRGPHRTGV